MTLFKRTIIIDCENCKIVQDTMSRLEEQKKESDKQQLEQLNTLVNSLGSLSENISNEVKEDNRRMIGEFRKELNEIKDKLNNHENRIEKLEKVRKLKQKTA